MTARPFALPDFPLKVPSLILFLLTMLVGHTAHAQAVESEAVSTTTAVETDSVNEFRRLLAEPEIQAWLENAATATDQGDAASPLFREQLGSLLGRIRTRLEELRAAAFNTRSAPTIIANGWQTQLTPSDTLRVAIYIVIFLFVGAGFEWLYAQYTHSRLLNLQFRSPENLRERVTTASLRALIMFGSLFVFAVGSIGAFLNFRWPEVIADIVLDILIIVLVVRVATTISRFFLSPSFEELRLVPFSSSQSKSIHRWVGVLVLMGVINFAVSDIFGQIVSMSTNDIPKSAVLSVDVFINFLWLLVILLAIWSIRRLFTGSAEGSSIKPTSMWHLYLKILAVAVFLLWVIALPKLMWTVLILGLLFPVIVMCRLWVDNLFDQAEQIDALHGEYAETVDEIGSDEQVSAPTAEVDVELSDVVDPNLAVDADDDLHAHIVKKYEVYRPIARRVVRFVLVIFAVLMLIVAWDINLFALSSSQSIGGRIFETVVDVVIAILIADLIWVWAKSAIDRRLADYEPPLDGQAPGPEARMATLLPLLRTILMITLVTMVLLSVLAAAGVNIAPLLAGAGVLGVAIGFGAQALVRDVVSGIFFLVDDAFRVGEYIEIEGLRGTVEGMSIRSLRIRHHRGAVHTIPFGELKALTNYSRDWVIMKLEFRVPFDTDLKLVKKLIKTIGAELQQNPDYGHAIIQPLKSQGVRRMEEFNMVVGAKFMAKPGEQWLIRRDAFQKVRDAFDANGIVFAERNVKVEVLNTVALDKATEEAAVGAVQEVIEQELPKGPAPDEP